VTDAPEPPVARDAATPGEDHGDEVPPMLPSRTAFLLAFAAVVVAGTLGGIIGFGIADVSSDSGIALFVGALVGALVGAGGVGIVAVLVLRAMAEWKRQAS
jgi:hypothetical protein